MLLEHTLNWELVKAAASSMAAATPIDTTNWVADPWKTKSKEQIRAEMFGTATGATPSTSTPQATTGTTKSTTPPVPTPPAGTPTTPAPIGGSPTTPAQTQPQPNYSNFNSFGKGVNWDRNAYEANPVGSSWHVGGIGQMSQQQYDAYQKAYKDELERQRFNGQDLYAAQSRAAQMAKGWIRKQMNLDSVAQ